MSSASDWFKQIFSQTAVGSDVSLGRSFLSSFLRRHFPGKPVVASLLSNRVYELKLPTSQSSQYASAPLLSAYYPCRRHSLIYDNTGNHNSPICIPPPPPIPPPALVPKPAPPTQHVKDCCLRASWVIFI